MSSTVPINEVNARAAKDFQFAAQVRTIRTVLEDHLSNFIIMPASMSPDLQTCPCNELKSALVDFIRNGCTCCRPFVDTKHGTSRASQIYDPTSGARAAPTYTPEQPWVDGSSDPRGSNSGSAGYYQPQSDPIDISRPGTEGGRTQGNQGSSRNQGNNSFQVGSPPLEQAPIQRWYQQGLQHPPGWQPPQTDGASDSPPIRARGYDDSEEEGNEKETQPAQQRDSTGPVITGFDEIAWADEHQDSQPALKEEQQDSDTAAVDPTLNEDFYQTPGASATDAVDDARKAENSRYRWHAMNAECWQKQNPRNGFLADRQNFRRYAITNRLLSRGQPVESSASQEGSEAPKRSHQDPMSYPAAAPSDSATAVDSGERADDDAQETPLELALDGEPVSLRGGCTPQSFANWQAFFACLCCSKRSTEWRQESEEILPPNRVVGHGGRTVRTPGIVLTAPMPAGVELQNMERDRK